MPKSSVIRKFMNMFVKDERGISSIEYAMIAVLVLGALAGVMVATKADISAIFTGMQTSVHAAAAAAT